MCTHGNVLLETKVKLAISWTSGNRKCQELPTPTTVFMHAFLHSANNYKVLYISGTAVSTSENPVNKNSKRSLLS